MRPERIVVEGFGTFRDRTEIDFRGVDLFALTGATGAGKSTVIDAIVFALYGAIPRLEDRSLVAPAISQDKFEAKVQLDFAVGDDRYTAVRVVREVVTKAKQASAPAGPRTATTKEARLERRISASETEVLAGTADELTAAVERLLGLTFEHFTTCVVLPQGQFARFLHHQPRHRQGLLVELLDLGIYDDMKVLAGTRAKTAEQQLGFLGKERERLADATPEAALQYEQRVSSLETVLATIDDRQPKIDALALDIREGERQRADASGWVERLSAVEIPKGISELASEGREVAAALEAAKVELRTTVARADAADAKRESLGDRTQLEVAVRDHAELAKQRERLAKGEGVVQESQERVDVAMAAAEAARAALEHATTDLEDARLANRAAELAGHLISGEPCPVCGNEVHKIPKHKAPGLDKAQKAEAKAKAAATKAVDALTGATGKHDQLVVRLAAVEETIAEIEARLADRPSVKKLEAALAKLDDADALVQSARAEAKQAQQKATAAEKQQKNLEARSVDAWKSFDAVRDRVAALEPPPADRTDLLAAWQPLVEWSAVEVKRYEQERADIGAAIEKADKARTALVDQIGEACADAGVQVGRRPARDAVVDALADARANVESVRDAIARRGELDGQIGKLDAEQKVAKELARHLSANGFEKWVLDEALERLVLGATQILHDLSGGAYSLLLDPKTRSFFVRDHKNADALRSARTLSGGETFLASLALALALADQVAEMAAAGAVRLESIFLDEGFGTLDPDTLDTVASAIEELGARGRMVGLVSHVRELAERMPVRYVVEKGPSTSTISRVDL